MKKLFVGIVTLVAAVMLSSPAFGALTWDVPDPNTGIFTFEVEIEDVLKLDMNSGAYEVIVAMKNEWVPPLSDVVFYKEFEDDRGDFPTDATSGVVDFINPVQIVLAKWGGLQYAFLLNGYTQTFEWANLNFEMSHVRGYNSVPVPAAVWLLGSGVLGLVAVRRRRS